MQIVPSFPLVTDIIQSYAGALGEDLPAYRNHVCRVLNFFLALNAPNVEVPEQVLIAAAFHDIGIWTDRTLDYLSPSVREASAYLSKQGSVCHATEIEAIITQHHKLRRYTGQYEDNVERYRKADMVDLSLGFVRFGLPVAFVQSVKAAFPNQGFHRRLAMLTGRQLIRAPLRPLPMIRW